MAVDSQPNFMVFISCSRQKRFQLSFWNDDECLVNVPGATLTRRKKTTTSLSAAEIEDVLARSSDNIVMSGQFNLAFFGREFASQTGHAFILQRWNVTFMS